MSKADIIRKTWEYPQLRPHAERLIENQTKKCYALADRLEQEINTLVEMKNELRRLKEQEARKM